MRDVTIATNKNGCHVLHERESKPKSYHFKAHGGYEDHVGLSWGHFYLFGKGFGFPMNILSRRRDQFQASYGAKWGKIRDTNGVKNGCF